MKRRTGLADTTESVLGYVRTKILHGRPKGDSLALKPTCSTHMHTLTTYSGLVLLRNEFRAIIIISLGRIMYAVLFYLYHNRISSSTYTE